MSVRQYRVPQLDWTQTPTGSRALVSVSPRKSWPGARVDSMVYKEPLTQSFLRPLTLAEVASAVMPVLVGEITTLGALPEGLTSKLDQTTRVRVESPSL